MSPYLLYDDCSYGFKVLWDSIRSSTKVIFFFVVLYWYLAYLSCLEDAVKIFLCNFYTVTSAVEYSTRRVSLFRDESRHLLA